MQHASSDAKGAADSLASRVGEARADDEIVDADREPRGVTGVDALNHEAGAPITAVSRQQARKLERGGEARRPAEKNATLACIEPSAGIAEIGAYDEIVDTVAVDISGIAHRDAGEIVLIDAAKHEAGTAVTRHVAFTRVGWYTNEIISG